MVFQVVVETTFNHLAIRLDHQNLVAEAAALVVKGLERLGPQR